MIVPLPPGPMPLERAREILRGATAFVRGDVVHEVGHPAMTTADVLWGALLSLADAEELVREASRLDWQFHPRGFDNVELHDRYGDGILPWLATRVDERNVLHNHPWCVLPCLLRCASPEAFALVWRIEAVEGRTPWGGAGDGDLATAWCRRHPEVAATELALRAAEQPRARAYLTALGHGPPLAPPTADTVLALLDACAAGLFATRVRLTPSAGQLAMRAVAARAGDDWGLALEWVDGTRPSGLFAARVAGLAFGSRVHGPVRGVALTSRPVPALEAADLDVRLGAPALSVPPLGLPGDAAIVAVVPHVAAAPIPSASPVFRALADAIAHEPPSLHSRIGPETTS